MRPRKSNLRFQGSQMWLVEADSTQRCTQRPMWRLSQPQIPAQGTPPGGAGGGLEGGGGGLEGGGGGIGGGGGGRGGGGGGGVGKGERGSGGEGEEARIANAGVERVVRSVAESGAG